MAERFIVIAGPCVIESEKFALEVALDLKQQLAGLDIQFLFKASFDKANRTSIKSFRGVGLEKGKKVFERILSETGLRSLTDIHEPWQVKVLAPVMGGLQIPAFLCRQTDLIEAGVKGSLEHGYNLNIKKGQFLAPWDVKNIIEKCEAISGQSSMQMRQWLTLTERGVSFGYN